MTASIELFFTVVDYMFDPLDLSRLGLLRGSELTILIRPWSFSIEIFDTHVEVLAVSAPIVASPATAVSRDTAWFLTFDRCRRGTLSYQLGHSPTPRTYTGDKSSMFASIEFLLYHLITLVQRQVKRVSTDISFIILQQLTKGLRLYVHKLVRRLSG